MSRSKDAIEYHRLTESGKETLRKEYISRVEAQSDSVGRGAPDDFEEKRISVFERVIYERNIVFTEGQYEDLLKFFQPAFDHLTEYHKQNLAKRQKDIEWWEEQKRNGKAKAYKLSD